MQQFIPFDDDWDALANLRLEDLVPYRVGMLRDTRFTTVAAFQLAARRQPASHHSPIPR